jgi:hypothetical protein
MQCTLIKGFQVEQQQIQKWCSQVRKIEQEETGQCATEVNIKQISKTKNAISNTIYRKNWTRRNIPQANETRNTAGTQKHSHPSWGRVTTNRRGCRFLSFSGNSSMQLTNCPVTATKITCNSLLFGILWSLLQNPPWELNWPRSHWKSQTQACQQAVVR